MTISVVEGVDGGSLSRKDIIKEGTPAAGYFIIDTPTVAIYFKGYRLAFRERDKMSGKHGAEHEGGGKKGVSTP